MAQASQTKKIALSQRKIKWPAPPKKLRAAAKKYWTLITDELNPDVYERTDHLLLCDYCQAMAMKDAAVAAWEKSGSPFVEETSRGGSKQHPMLVTIDRRQGAINMLATKLRLAPSSRYSGWKTAGMRGKRKTTARSGMMYDDE